MKKKAFFFLLDGIFAIFILTIGYMMLTSEKSFSSSDVPLSASAEDGANILSSIKVSELCNQCSCSNSVLSDYCQRGIIKNRNQSLMDYFGELYYFGRIDDAKELFENIRVLSLDDNAVIKSADIYAEMVKKGNEISNTDCLIAGIALSNGVNSIVTKNISHFSRIKGLKVESY
jgi:hypothetical protein